MTSDKSWVTKTIQQREVNATLCHLFLAVSKKELDLKLMIQQTVHKNAISNDVFFSNFQNAVDKHTGCKTFFIFLSFTKIVIMS